MEASAHIQPINQAHSSILVSPKQPNAKPLPVTDTSSLISARIASRFYSLITTPILTMKSSRRIRLYSSSVTTIDTATVERANFPQTTSTEIPVTFHLSNRESTAAVKIQSAYRSHAIRKLTNKIKAVDYEADKLQRLIQRQETVDAVRSNHKERIKINEALMKLLFTLDSVPGFDPTVREFRRNVSRRIVGLQEILDSICEANEGNWDAFLRDFDDIIAGIEHDVCVEQGGSDSNEFERFCVEKLGFRCLQRFLHQ